MRKSFIFKKLFFKTIKAEKLELKAIIKAIIFFQYSIKNNQIIALKISRFKLDKELLTKILALCSN